jgi:type I restriction enzyme S subunit
MTSGNGGHHGFRIVKLVEVVDEAVTGFACGQRAPNGVVQLRMNNVTRRGTLDWSSFIRVPTDNDTLETYSLRCGDVVFNNTNSTEMVGKTALFEHFDEPVVFSNHFTRIRTRRDALAPEFLALWLHSKWQSGLFARICDRWIGQSAVQRNKLLDLEIVLPPLKEQRLIAARLRERLSISAEARTALEAQLEAADALPAANLRAVFESEEAKRWPMTTIAELIRDGTITEHQDGNHGELHPRNKDFVPDGVKFITAKHIDKDGTLAWDSAPSISHYQANGLRIGFARGNDVLLAHNATVGKVGIAPAQCEAFVVGTSVTIYRADNQRLEPKFLFYALNSREFQTQLIDAMKQTTRNQVPITKQRGLRLRIPSYDAQVETSKRLDEESSAARTLREAIQKKVDDLGKLPGALLRAAFQG